MNVSSANPSGINIFNDALQFTTLILDELRQGYERMDSDHTILGYSVHKLINYQCMLSNALTGIEHEGLREALETLSRYISEFLERSESFDNSSNNDLQTTPVSLCMKLPSSSGGRPKIMVEPSVLERLRNSGMSKTSIARFLGISRQTLYNQWTIPEEESLTDDELLQCVTLLKAENRTCGERYVTGHLVATRLKVSRNRVRQALRHVDPIGTAVRQRLKTKRRQYSNKGPNFLWHMDGNEKLQPFRLYMHGCIDGFSRKIMYLKCASSKKARIVLEIFRSAIEEFGVPKRVRSDKGRENIRVAEYMLQLRGSDSKCFITGRSLHNVRIERLWGEVNKVTRRYKDLLAQLQHDGEFDLDNCTHMFAVAYVYIPLIQNSLDIFLQQWNHHKLSNLNKSPEELYLTGCHAEGIPHERILEINGDSLEDDPDELNDLASEYEIFQNFAKTIIPDPSIDDGTTGVSNLRALIATISSDTSG